MFDNLEIENDLAEMRIMHDERQQRLVEALMAMEMTNISTEDKEVIWFESGLSRSVFLRKGHQ